MDFYIEILHLYMSTPILLIRLPSQNNSYFKLYKVRINNSALINSVLIYYQVIRFSVFICYLYALSIHYCSSVLIVILLNIYVSIKYYKDYLHNIIKINFFFSFYSLISSFNCIHIYLFNEKKIVGNYEYLKI